jgi:hypothetical protein
MRKILPFFACLALFACSDMGESLDAVTVRELPSDFDAGIYAEINTDVPHSQLVFALKDSAAKASSESVKADCNAFLGSADMEFLEKVYLEYLGCPRQALDTLSACPTGWNNNPAYSSPFGKSNKQCQIPGCWIQGWDDNTQKDLMAARKDSLAAEIQEADLAHPEVCDIPDPSAEELEWCEQLEAMQAQLDALTQQIDKLDSNLVKNWSLLVAGDKKLATVATNICLFNLVQTDGSPDLAKDKAYLEAFRPDSYLLERHYVLEGRIEGRPYRYCDALPQGAQKGAERGSIVPDTLLGSGTSRLSDYSANLFCFDKADSRIYAIQ